MKLSFDSEIDALLARAIDSSLSQLAENHGVSFREEIFIGLNANEGVSISARFNEQFKNKQFHHEDVLSDRGFVEFENGSLDRVGSIVYFLNYFQEYADNPTDDLGRFQFAGSHQAKYDTTSQNLVLQLFRDFCREHLSQEVESKPSRIFISHDNDSLFGSLYKDGFHAFKTGRIDWIFRILWSEIMGNPRWMNMDRMMDINDEYDLKSTFFWIADNRKKSIGQRTLANGDYQIDSSKIKDLSEKIAARGFHQGLHKSLHDNSFEAELKMLPFAAKTNRNHYLKLQVPNHFEAIDSSSLLADFSLGFAEEFGLRNNYAMPFRPFNLNKGETTKAMYVPLMIMDTTNWSYKKLNHSQFKSTLLNLLEQHKSDAVISILWHNKYFTDMKFDGYLEVYRALLDYCRQNDIRPIDQEELINTYRTG